jgi:hypothetical protein
MRIVSEEKRMAGAYEILYAIHIGDKEIVFGENPDMSAPTRYFAGWCDKGDFYERYIGDETGDYLEAMKKFISDLSEQIEKVEQERAAVTVPMAPITAEQCYPNDLSQNIEGKVVAVRAGVLRSEYQTADRQLVLVTGGFGSHANSRGSAVFCTNLYSGKHTRWERRDIQGEVKPKHIPEWAKERLAALQAEKQTPEKSNDKER